MREQKKTNSEVYIESLIPEENLTKQASRKAAAELGLDRISVSIHEAQLIKVLIALAGCKRFIEIGTLTGLSAQYIWEALPANGELWTLEKAPEHAEKAQTIFTELNQKSGQNKKIHLVVGDAREELEKLSNLGPFDGVFIDGNKAAYGDYLAWSEKNIKPGGLILADNVFLSGAVWGEEAMQKFSTKQIKTLQEFNMRLSNAELYQCVIINTFEGLAVAIKLF
jgi:predicted O-methyltransferase YrrM